MNNGDIFSFYPVLGATSHSCTGRICSMEINKIRDLDSNIFVLIILGIIGLDFVVGLFSRFGL